MPDERDRRGRGARARPGHPPRQGHRFTAFIWLCGVLALIPLACIAFHVSRGPRQALSGNFFTKEPAGPLNPNAGGIVQSFIGTGMIVGIAMLIAVPLGSSPRSTSPSTGRAGPPAIRFVAEHSALHALDRGRRVHLGDRRGRAGQLLRVRRALSLTC